MLESWRSPLRVRRWALFAACLSLLISMSTAVTGPATAAVAPGNPPAYPYAATNYTEPLRGQFHFSSQNGWMNDINGPVYYRGVYHMFFQNNPRILGHGDKISWGQATSTDLVHWTQKPLALDALDYPSADFYSGSAWVDTNNVTGLKAGGDDPILLFYGKNGVYIAYSTDGAQTFRLYGGGQPVAQTSTESRDPKVQWDPAHNRWTLALFAKDSSGQNGANFYSSTNLLTWTYTGRYAGSWLFECPDLYQLPVDGIQGNGKWVLQDAGGQYVLGQLDANSVFVPDPGWSTPQTMDRPGAVFPGPWYAAQTFNQVPGGRVVQMAWQGANSGSVWNGDASFPVDVALKTFPEGVRITRDPVSEIASLRTGTTTWPARTISTDPATDPFAGISADTYEIQAEFDLSGTTASQFGFEVHRQAGGVTAGGRSLVYDVSAQTFYGQPLPPIGTHVKIRLLVDRGQLEIYGNDGKMVFSDNASFDSSPASQGIKLFATGGTVNLVSLTFSSLRSAWEPALGGSLSNNAIAFTTNQSHCLDRDVASGRVQIWDCLGNTNQAWTLNSDSTLTTGGQCLQTPVGDTASHALVSVGSCTGGTNQKWTRADNGSAINQASGRCLDLDSGDLTNGRQLQIYDCLGNTNQSWVGAPAPPRAAPITWTKNSGKCVDQDVASGRVQIWDCLGNTNQAWTLNTDGSVTDSGLCLGTPVGNSGNGAPLTATACTGAPNQQWSRTGTSLLNLASERCLDVDSGNATNGRQLLVWDCLNDGNQAFSHIV